MALPPGTLLAARYRLADVIGQGGMGVVYRARDERLGRDVAVKTLEADKQDDGDARARLLREARATGRVEHAGIVKIFDAGETPDGDVFLVMELVRGKTVRELAKAGIARDRVVRIVSETAKALALAHRAGLVHRDVKPENVMVRDDGGVVLLDFGVVKSNSAELAETMRVGESSSIATAAGQIIGTTAYLAPEQARAEVVGPEADQFALAVMAYELLTKRLPWSASQPVAMLAQILFKAHEAPSAIDRDLPRAVDAVFSRALAKDAGDRYASIAAFASDLARAVDDRASVRPRRRARALIAVTAVALSGALGHRAVESRVARAEPAEATRIEPFSPSLAPFIMSNMPRMTDNVARAIWRARADFDEAGPGSRAGDVLVHALALADAREEARTIAADYMQGPGGGRLLGEDMLAVIEIEEGKLEHAERRLSSALERASSYDDLGVVESTRDLVVLADVTGHASSIAAAWWSHFERAPGKLDASHFVSGDERPFIAVCMRLPAPAASACFDRAEALVGESTGALLIAAGRRHLSGDHSGALAAIRVLEQSDALELVPIQLCNGDDDCLSKIDDELAARFNYAGIPPTLPLRAKRAERNGDHASAIGFARAVVDAWRTADAEPPAVVEMQGILRGTKAP